MDLPFLQNIPVLVSALFYIILLAILLILVKKKSLEEPQIHRFLKIIIGIFVLSYLIYSVTSHLERDELEHIQCAWLVFKGGTPYHDFFQHHHSLLWYIFSSVFFLTDEGLFAVVLIRLVNFSFLLGIMFVIYRITFELTSSKKTALFSLTVVLATNIFTRNSVAIRPDVLMTLFALISYLFLILFLKKNRIILIVFSGLFLALSFIALQKAVFVILPFLILILALWIKKKLSLMQLFTLGISALLPVLIFVSIYWISGYLKEYLVYNWIFNFLKPGKNPVYKIFFKP